MSARHPMSLQVGDVLNMKAIKVYRGDLQLGFSPPTRKDYFVVLLLGVSTPSSEVNAEKVLNSMGWFFKADHAKTKVLDGSRGDSPDQENPSSASSG